jgi:putative DNA primase/helicase
MVRAKATVRQMYEMAALEPNPERRMKLVKHALASEQAMRLRGMAALAESEPGIPVTPDDLDRDAWLLNVNNGTIDLRTGQLREHRREDLLTKLAPVDYTPGAHSALWERFLRDVTGGDEALIAFLQRAVGYSLTGSTEEEVLFFVHGPAASGKSTFVEAVKAILGGYAMTADFEAFLARPTSGGPRNDVARLAAARFVVSIEVDEGKKLAQGLVKTITGGDTVTARFLYQEAFEFKPAFKLWLAANHKPQVGHHDAALWRRIRCVPFDRPIPAERRDPEVKKRLTDPAAEGPAVLNWAIEGCLRWQDSRLGTAPAVLAATEAYREEMDALADFFAARCVFEPGAMVKAGVLGREYKKWVARNYEQPVSPAEFADGLRAHGCKDGHTKDARYWRGVRIRLEGDTGDTTFGKPSLESARMGEVTETGVTGVTGVTQCRMCGGEEHWVQPSGRSVCSACHPRPRAPSRNAGPEVLEPQRLCAR